MHSDQPVITIITPCYNESIIVILFLEQVAKAVADLPFFFRVVVVDDCSTDDTLQLLQAFTFGSNNIRLTVVSMPENSGHQAAIYKGLVEGLERSILYGRPNAYL